MWTAETAAQFAADMRAIQRNAVGYPPERVAEMLESECRRHAEYYARFSATVAEFRALPPAGIQSAIRCFTTMGRPHASGSLSYAVACDELRSLGVVSFPGLFLHDRAEIVRMFTLSTTETKEAA